MDHLPSSERSGSEKSLFRRAWSGLFNCLRRPVDCLSGIWRWLCDLWVLIRPSRLSFIAVLLYGLFIIASAQGRELFLLSGDYWGRYFLFITLFALNVWLWARLMVSYRFLPPERRYIDHEYLGEDVKCFKRVHESKNEEEGYSRDEIEKEEARIKAYEKKKDQLLIDDCSLWVDDCSRIDIDSYRTWMLRIPRLYGFLVFIASAISAIIVWWKFLPSREVAIEQGFFGHYGFLLYGLVLALSGALFWWLVHKRRDLCWCIRVILRIGFGEGHSETGLGSFRVLFRSKENRKELVRRYQPDFGKELKGWRKLLDTLFEAKSEGDLRDDWRWYSWAVIPGSAKFWLYVISASLFAFFVFALWDPIAFSRIVTPLGSILLPLSFLTMLGTWLVFWFDDRRFPIVSGLFLLAVLGSWLSDSHPVRLIGEAKSPEVFTPDQRVSAAKFVESASSMTARPIIVATAGGGIRAAYWTALVLAELDKEPGFRNGLLAISTVSGGGLGAASYLAAVDCASRLGDAEESARQDVGKLVTRFLSKDFLSATMAAYLTRDLFPGLLPDRAQALERSWELGWRETCSLKDRNLFASGFLGLWQGPDQVRPALLLNGTLIQSGKRIIAAPIRIEPMAFREAQDLYEFVGNTELPMSTAVHNGARFTYLSPAGTLKLKVGNETLTTGQVIDGGYFENYGAETAGDLLVSLCQQGDNPRCPARKRPIVIQISSDPGLADDAELSTTGHGPGSVDRVDQLQAPLAGFGATRAARGVSAMKRLRQLSEAYGATFAHLRLCQLKGRQDPPLGWLLSYAARKTIEAHLDTPCEGPVSHHNSEQMQILVEALKEAS